VHDRKERQANKFAACFLMPKKRVIEAFKEEFMIDKFVATQNNIFALTFDSHTLASFKAHYPQRHDVSRFLAASSLSDKCICGNNGNSSRRA
jgi:hypothetical protein